MVKTLEIKGARVRLGFTQDYVAEQLGLTASSYSKKERGKTKFTLDQVVKLAELLQLNMSQVNEYILDGRLSND